MRRYYRDSQTGQLVYINDPGSVYFDGYQSQQQQQPNSGIAQYAGYAKDAYNLYNNFSSSESLGASSSLTPYAALASALMAFKKNSDWMAEGSKNHGWFKTMLDEGLDPMFGREGLYGLFSNLFQGKKIDLNWF
jgi:hypothetical protein